MNEYLWYWDLKLKDFNHSSNLFKVKIIKTFPSAIGDRKNIHFQFISPSTGKLISHTTGVIPRLFKDKVEALLYYEEYRIGLPPLKYKKKFPEVFL